RTRSWTLNLYPPAWREATRSATRSGSVVSGTALTRPRQFEDVFDVQRAMPQPFDVEPQYWRSRILQLSECLSVASRDFGFDGLSGGSLAAAVGGGVSGPVAAAGALPG